MYGVFEHFECVVLQSFLVACIGGVQSNCVCLKSSAVTCSITAGSCTLFYR